MVGVNFAAAGAGRLPHVRRLEAFLFGDLGRLRSRRGALLHQAQDHHPALALGVKEGAEFVMPTMRSSVSARRCIRPIRALMRRTLLAAALLSRPRPGARCCCPIPRSERRLRDQAADFEAPADKVCRAVRTPIWSRSFADGRRLPRALRPAQQSLSDPAKAYSYTLTIKEVLVFAEVAIVRLVWTLTVERSSHRVKPCRRGRIGHLPAPTRGQWKYIRFTTYDCSRRERHRTTRYAIQFLSVTDARPAALAA